MNAGVAVLERPAPPASSVDSAGGGVPARRAMVRWAWRLFRREWRQQFLILAMVTVAVAAVVVGATAAVGSQSPATFGFALVGAGLSNVVPTLFSAAAGLASVPAAGVATVATVGYAGLLSGPVVIGAIAQSASLRLGVAFLVVCAVGAALTARSLRA